jgi:uncharacterized protein (TIGR02145 family)
MKKSKMFLIVSGIFVCLIIWQACQKDDELATIYSDVETMQLKNAGGFNCSTVCIDPDDTEYFVAHDKIVVGWAGPEKNKFNKTVEVKYYNTLTHFVLQVTSSNGITDVLMDDISVKNFSGTIPPDKWHEFSFELEADWEACDTWGFELIITGFGPPAQFDVEYRLIGQCVYTLGLAVNPEGAGSVSGEGEYMEGEEVALTATANEGYIFVNWTDEGGNEISNLADFTYTMPAYDVTLTANFGEEYAEWPRDTDTEIVEVTNPETGRTWMDRNLGASRAATSSDDAEAYGDLYQWGRAADGHEKRTSGTTSDLSNSDKPGHGDFITINSELRDWRSPQNNNLWQDVSGTNNPCPAGYRLPTYDEWAAERNTWISLDAAGAFASPLKLPVAGLRYFSSGNLYDADLYGLYWSSSTAFVTDSHFLFIKSSETLLSSFYRAYGFSVRCIKD